MSIHSEGISRIVVIMEISKIANVLKSTKMLLQPTLMHNMLISQLRRDSRVREDKIFQDNEMNSNTSFLDLGFSKVEVNTERYRG